MIRLFLTRHGQTQWNVEKRFQGSLDSALTELGVKQAKLLRDRLAHEKFDIIYSSHLNRAYKTAEIIKGNREIEIIKDENLAEMRLGKWEGLKHDEIMENYSKEYELFWNKPHLYKPSTGEGYNELEKRVIGCLKGIIEENDGKNVLIVSHTVVVKQIMAYFENRPLEKLWDLPFIYPTSLSLVEIDNDIVEIKMHADISHFENSMKVNC
ncbi:histidine phosphatase family protein [Paramaledivibacter caminithermalis]|uniref:Probable phosphoglycerate mutase n=1 Tax=Paramaledivibacter caminithermalis (strain DSM 15212 / CIP 107654 / DViRD3) TaxID=1121301 RepID=A0A1M6JKD4_PARC5|nr:histidine phosphatase family protein [Paramaledivibacter caminithermalis]SHJ47157.1 probable phosphoglycerate mutase [Paramaledivibacter caminithermalis DSM 15212]